MVLRIITVISCVLYMLPKLRLGVHMLQQEFYLNANYFNWVKKHPGKNFLVGDVFLPAAALICTVFI